jgi:hypothetical protein
MIPKQPECKEYIDKLNLTERSPGGFRERIVSLRGPAQWFASDLERDEAQYPEIDADKVRIKAYEK